MCHQISKYTYYFSSVINQKYHVVTQFNSFKFPSNHKNKLFANLVTFPEQLFKFECFEY